MSKVKNGGVQKPQTQGGEAANGHNVAAYLLKKAAADLGQSAFSVSLPGDLAAFIVNHFTRRGEKSEFIERACRYYLEKSGIEIDQTGCVIKHPQV